MYDFITSKERIGLEEIEKKSNPDQTNDILEELEMIKRRVDIALSIDPIRLVGFLESIENKINDLKETIIIEREIK